MPGILNQIRGNIQKSASGNSRAAFFYIKSNEKKRIRFLTDMEDGVPIQFHVNWDTGLNSPCFKHYGRKCPYCGTDEGKDVQNFAWPIWNYESSQVEIYCFKASNQSLVGMMIPYYESYGTIKDRDYTVSRTGERLETRYALIPGDKAPFKSRVKVPDRQEILKMTADAFLPPMIDGKEVKAVSLSEIATEDDSEIDNAFDDVFEDDEEEEEEEEQPKASKRKRG